MPRLSPARPSILGQASSRRPLLTDELFEVVASISLTKSWNHLSRFTLEFCGVGPVGKAYNKSSAPFVSSISLPHSASGNRKLLQL